MNCAIAFARIMATARSASGAPARINLLGEHVDYVSYLPTASLPFASREHEMLMLYRAAPDKRVRGASTRDAYAPFAFDLGDGPLPSDATEPAWLAYLNQLSDTRTALEQLC